MLVVPSGCTAMIASSVSISRSSFAASHTTVLWPVFGSVLTTRLPIGTYDLKFSREGFRSVEVHGIQLSVGQTRTVDAQLDVGVISSKIEVQAEVAALKQ